MDILPAGTVADWYSTTKGTSCWLILFCILRVNNYMFEGAHSHFFFHLFSDMYIYFNLFLSMQNHSGF